MPVALVQQRPEWNVEMPMYVTYSDLIQIGIFGGMLNPPDVRKEGDANGYIFRAFSDRYLHCRSRWIVLHNLREKKIAATTAIVTAVTM